MGKRGPKPKPKSLKKLQGTLRPDRERKRAPVVSVLELPAGAPACPAWLSKGAREEWSFVVPHLLKLGVLAEVDSGILERYCTAQADWRKWQREVQRRPYLTVNGQRFINPAAKLVRSLGFDADRLARQLKLTPDARARGTPAAPSKPGDELGAANAKLNAAPDDPAKAFLFGAPKLVPPTGTDKP